MDRIGGIYMATNIVTGKKYHILTDFKNKVWSVISFWTKASDVEFNDGKSAEAKHGAINGITSDVNCEDETIAASAAMVNELNNELNSKLGTQVTMTLSGTTLTITTKK